MPPADSTVERIPIASDHAGYELKKKLVGTLWKTRFEFDDKGTRTSEPSDYPDFAKLVALDVATGNARRGVLLCGSGIGMDIVANRYRGVRAALAWNEEIAKLSRQHNDSNILVIPARFVSDEEATRMLETWLSTPFEGGRHAKRVDKIDEGKSK